MFYITHSLIFFRLYIVKTKSVINNTKFSLMLAGGKNMVKQEVENKKDMREERRGGGGCRASDY